MAQLTQVLGFFTKWGSRDLPFNTNVNAKFGWDNTDGSQDTAIFGYSLNDCEKACTVCRTLVKQSYHKFDVDNADPVSTLIAEAGKTTAGDFTPIAQEDVGETFWTDVFKCLEWLYANQASISGASWDTSLYMNYGDAMLASPTKSNGTETNLYRVESYLRGSLSFSRRANSDRIQYVSFQVNNPKLGYIPLTIYFDADAWFERSSNVAYKVYRYEDLNDDDHISNIEFDKQIVEKLFDILKLGGYKKYAAITVNKRISDTSTVEEQFFVFSSINIDLTSTLMKQEIVKYLTDKYNRDTTYLRYTYPDLFGENAILLVPMWDNQVTVSGGGSQDVSPLSGARLSTLLGKFGYTIVPNAAGYKPYEVFYIGPGAGWSPALDVPFKIPIVAIELDDASGITTPISSRFPSYNPIYGQNIKGDAAEFHFVLLKIMTHFKDSTSKITDDAEFAEEYSCKSETVILEGTREVITFSFSGNVYSIYGPVKSEAN